MRFQKTIFLLLFLPFVISAQQSSIDSLITQGIQLHDQGDFEGAVGKYTEALKIDPTSSLAHYEIAMSYLSQKEYEKAEAHSERVLNLNKGNLLEAHVALGNALDLQGKTKKALKVYEQGTKKYDHYLLHYNYAIACLNAGKVDMAYEAALSAINNNSGHASSHLILSKIMDQKNSRIQAMLPLYFFLLLEPDSERAAIEYKVLRGYLDHGVTRESERKVNISVPIGNDSEFGAAEMMVSLVKSSENLEENKGRSDLELFANHNDKIFKILGELKDDNSGFWWDFYVSFFHDLATNYHTVAFSHYISLSQGKKAKMWLQNHQEEVDAFSTWASK